ncbi:MAG: hypothetical protein CO186_12350 [Zetaproteobacteria bacterium CG_4_9_14_3_um_filter_49_83]|nr:MAG: hypothetical protein AUJ56_09985 [Zetaproteobacteria bacterium CG1_02_49_23]PIQ34221.1 MAG: hypothetical protein COW62_02625 [Zetaproteobacteria bacterium CG17_big_fil_post_rev_8_21_14_2_50_50_13]PIV31083.1 MAG: hypothetical protein COS35_03325 [Zetaproteobacteria bacterium CG02_land_8_20_14_3_00_50_9]PIY57140.1 MAG: hypothetical protein COZ00_00480 [Zetaproteobacteria bacterium CG_4_10_14_0_8_um_filter_49_80]PJA33954.1 MAG: hypothetical protein CO186_12350 [Zetaproteobacteria bacterium
MKNTISVLALLAMTFTPAMARSETLGAHVHGIALLQVAVEHDAMLLSFSSPLDNMLGFEHKPGNATEQAKTDVMAATLQHAETMFIANPEAACTLASVHLDSVALEADDADVEDHHHDGHADIDGEFIFHCSHADRLQWLDVMLFDPFPNLHRLKVEVVTPQRQAAAMLTNDERRVSW